MGTLITGFPSISIDSGTLESRYNVLVNSGYYGKKRNVSSDKRYNHNIINNYNNSVIVGACFTNPEVLREVISNPNQQLYAGILILSNNPFQVELIVGSQEDYNTESPLLYYQTIANSVIYTINGNQYHGFADATGGSSNNWDGLYTGIYSVSTFDTINEFIQASNIRPITDTFTITYRDTNCTHSGPDEASIGDTVTVSFQFTSGYGIVNPSSDVYVTNNGVVIPSQYSNGVLTFTMPDPS